MINAEETFKKIAEALPYEVQSALLAIRDDGNVTAEKVPAPVFFALDGLTLIEPVSNDKELLTLSKLGYNLVDYCSC